ncbi:DUF3927 domain-containing protein [Escherichia coli]|nr:DUF3927 domain-containing protein [Escherichia coli]TJR31034.1 DUF3927 domain-containing protein [Escherichia coli]
MEYLLTNMCLCIWLTFNFILLADGVLVVGIVVVLFPLVKKDMPGS